MVTERQATAAVKAVIPGYNTSINCYCNNPELYGCMRTPLADELYRDAKQEPQKGRRKRGKEKRHRYTFRASEAQEAALKRAKSAIMAETGITPSDQAAFEYIFHAYTESFNG